MSVVTNIDTDHMDTYDHSVDKLHQAFVDFIAPHAVLRHKRFVCRQRACARGAAENQQAGCHLRCWTDNAGIHATDMRAEGAQMRFTVQVKHDNQAPFEVVLDHAWPPQCAQRAGRHCGARWKWAHRWKRFKKACWPLKAWRRFQNYGEIAAA